MAEACHELRMKVQAVIAQKQMGIPISEQGVDTVFAALVHCR